MKLLTALCMLALLAGCSKIGDETSTTTTTSHSQGGGGQGGEGCYGGEQGGSGGSGGYGGQGGEGGSGGSCVGVCCMVPDAFTAVVFRAPNSDVDGMVGIAAWVDCPDGYQSVCTELDWMDPYPGAVAETGSEVIALFGILPSDTRVIFIPNRYEKLEADTYQSLNLWFNSITVDGNVYVGETTACIGQQAVGHSSYHTKPSDQEGDPEITGALSAEDDTANLIFAVP